MVPSTVAHFFIFDPGGIEQWFVVLLASILWNTFGWLRESAAVKYVLPRLSRIKSPSTTPNRVKNYRLRVLTFRLCRHKPKKHTIQRLRRRRLIQKLNQLKLGAVPVSSQRATKILKSEQRRTRRALRNELALVHARDQYIPHTSLCLNPGLVESFLTSIDVLQHFQDIRAALNVSG
jgi:hypothetical protein